MPKRTTVEQEKAPTGKEIRLPAESTIKVFNSAYDEAKQTVDGANEEYKEAATAAKSKHLNIAAFKDVKKLADNFRKAKNASIAADKLAAYLAQFDLLRKFFKLDESANLQTRMFGEGEIGSRPPRGKDEDGEPDMRPDHLRQPGASAAEPSQRPNPVADLATRAGAKTQEPIDQVGRGGKPDKPKLN